MKINKICIRFLFVLLLLDTGYSFLQHHSENLEGDMAGIVFPSAFYQKVLDDPFAIAVIKDGVSYPATNRFFAHQIMSSYFKSIPLCLQFFVSPIESIYLSNAIIKTIIQVLLIYLLAIFITGKTNLFEANVIIAMVLIAPIFQACGYHTFFGIIDSSITYTMFYALGNLLILVFILPFFLKYLYNKNIEFNLLLVFSLLVLCLVIAFHNPTNAGVILVLCPFVIFLFWFSHFKKANSNSVIGKAFQSIINIPKPVLFLFTIICVLCLYSFYIGTFNSENSWHPMSLVERYARLLKGIGKLITFKIGQFLFFAILFSNIILVFMQSRSEQRDRIIKLFWIVMVFSVVYTLLLPLGGFREYRPWIIRRDTIMPVLLALMIVYGMSSLYLYHHFNPFIKKVYIMVIGVFLIILSLADSLDRNKNVCERKALEKIALSPENKIILDDDCTVMSWKKFHNFNESDNAALMLHYWGVTNEPKWYKYEK